ncbi:RING finger protein 10-like isoform X2 [Limulus polyphemus]|nr:RING finger protein 10-like isoform X2 [Limulus polyphemus]
MGAEVGSAQNPGSKKINLNHLLNFTFTPRECGYGGNLRHKGGPQRRSTLPRYNKEKFLQANYQFIVRKDGNYTVHSVDPDILVDWSLVEEVRVPSYEVPSCPICLYPPTAAKITRCGHIYCWSCILHYLSLSDNSWRKCPICYEAVHKDDLKSVDFVNKITQKIGDIISLSLMRRDKGSVFAVPVTHWNGVIEKPFYIDEDAATTCFQKLLLASPEQVNTILNRERYEMLAQLKEEGDTPESCYIESALQILNEREGALQKQQLLQEETSLLMSQLHISKAFPSYGADDALNVAALRSEEWKTEKNKSYVDPFADENDDLVNLSATGSNENTVLLTNSSASIFTEEQLFSNAGTGSGIQICERTSFLELNNPQSCTDVERIDTKKFGRENYYFYQASDGQNIFLHALNVRMLVKEYGSLENCPATITAKILELEGASVDEASRKRMRYLRHLPVTCEFQFVELELKPPVVSKATVDMFMSEIVKRRRLRSRKAQQEKNREKYIEIEERKKLGKCPGARYHLDSLHHFPTWTGPENFNLEIQHLTDIPPSRPEEESISSETSSTTDLVSTAASDSPQIHSFSSSEDNATVRPTSFAEMLRESKSKHDHWGQPVKQQGKQTASYDIKVKEASSAEEDYVPVPEYHQSFSDAFQAALDSISQQNTSHEQEQRGGKKKKKVKKMVLIATTMNRGK